jgi:hypothetical protein
LNHKRLNSSQNSLHGTGKTLTFGRNSLFGSLLQNCAFSLVEISRNARLRRAFAKLRDSASVAAEFDSKIFAEHTELADVRWYSELGF